VTSLPPGAEVAAAESARRRAKARGRARLKALGIDVDTLTHEQVRDAYETLRAAYVDMAEAGRHMEPVRIDGDPLSGACAHARHGMLAAALADYFNGHPEGWSHPRVKWPTHHERAAGMRGQ
jgi:hypothetical protein